MSEFEDVVTGRVSKNFRRYLKKGENPQDNKSFSLVFSKRTVDLTAESEADCRQFVEAIKQLRKFM